MSEQETEIYIEKTRPAYSYTLKINLKAPEGNAHGVIGAVKQCIDFFDSKGEHRTTKPGKEYFERALELESYEDLLRYSAEFVTILDESGMYTFEYIG